MYGTKCPTQVSNPLEDGSMISLRGLNSCRNGSIRALLPISGSLVSSSLNHSWLVCSRTTLESISTLSILSISISSLFQKTANNTMCPKYPKTAATCMACSWTAQDGIKIYKYSTNLTTRSYIQQCLICCSYLLIPRRKPVRRTLTFVQFTRCRPEEVPCRRLGILPITCWVWFCRSKRARIHLIGWSEELLCWLSSMIETYPKFH